MISSRLYGKREIIVAKTQDREIQIESIADNIIRPDVHSIKRITESNDPVDAYFEWLFEQAKEQDFEVEVSHDKGIETYEFNYMRNYAEKIKGKVEEYMRLGWEVYIEF
jgi:hypothetical protein